jgi:hypothetical protein
MEIIKNGENISFWTKIFFSGNWEIKPKAINILKEKWKAIKTKKEKEFIIDYPGEYEKYDNYIQVISWNTDRLNFFVFDNTDNTSYAFIQDPSILEWLDLVRFPSKWYYLDEIVFNQIERLWFEWETIQILD